MAYDYNDIRNSGWFGRLMAKVGEGQMRSVQGTGSDPDDPYFAAKAAQERGDLSSARDDAFRREREAALGRWGVNQGAYQEREKLRQRKISAALADQWRPDQVLSGMGGGEAEVPGGMSDAGLQDQAGAVSAPGVAPEAFAAPMSGGYSMPESAAPYRPMKSPAYNPGEFQNPGLAAQGQSNDEEMRKILRQFYGKKGGGYGAV